MSQALGEGYLTYLIVAIPAFLTAGAAVLVPFGRWVASRWRPAADAAADGAQKLAAAYEDKAAELTDEKKMRMACEVAKDHLISELRYWRAGQTPPESERFVP